MNTKVIVNKDVLLEKLRQNRAIYTSEYDEVYKTYTAQAIKGLQKLLKDARKGKVVTNLNLVQPQNFTSSYDEIIGMLEMSVASTFEITQEEYKCYVLNQWSWGRSFDMIKTAYIK